MSFVNPAFLIALSAIAIPIIIHLIQLRKYKKFYFSNVSFLHSIEEQHRKSNKLKNLLILLARILTILFLVLAFAQPYIPQNNKSTNTGKNYVSIYVDNSYSMNRQSKNGTLLDDAKRKAKEIVSSFKNDDQFQLLGNEFSGNQQRWVSKQSFLENLEELKIRPESRSLSQVSARQSSLLKSNRGNTSKAFIISDFQASFAKNKNIYSLDSTIDWQMVVLESIRNQNVSIDSVWFNAPIHFPNSNENLLVKLNNYSKENLSAFPYEIKINGKVIGISNVDIPAESFIIDTFQYKNKNIGWQEAEITIKDQSLTFDNQYFFSYEIENSRLVSIIQGKEANNFVQSVYNTEPFFQTQAFDYRQINYKFLQSSKIIVLNEIDEFSTGLLSQIEQCLDRGSVVISFPSKDKNLVINNFNLKFNLAINSSELKSNEKIDKINFNTPLFDGIFLKQTNTNLDLPVIQAYFPFFKTGRISESILTLADGNDVLRKYTIAKGHIYQFAFPLNISYSNLPKHAMIVPLLLRMGTIHHQADAISYVLGENTMISIPNVNIDDRISNELRKGDFILIPEIISADAIDKIILNDQLKDAGIYTLTQNSIVLAKLAFNSSRKESDLSALNPSDLGELLGTSTKIWKTGDASIASLIKEDAFGQRLWKICVIFALFFMALEILIIRFGDVFLKQKSNN